MKASSQHSVFRSPRTCSCKLPSASARLYASMDGSERVSPILHAGIPPFHGNRPFNRGLPHSAGTSLHRTIGLCVDVQARLHSTRTFPTNQRPSLTATCQRCLRRAFVEHYHCSCTYERGSGFYSIDFCKSSRRSTHHIAGVDVEVADSRTYSAVVFKKEKTSSVPKRVDLAEQPAQPMTRTSRSSAVCAWLYGHTSTHQ